MTRRFPPRLAVILAAFFAVLSVTVPSHSVVKAIATLPIALATQVSGTLPLANGGTGQTSFASGVLQSNGSAISSTTVALTSQVTGTLPLGNGGTGQTSFSTGALSSNGSALTSGTLALGNGGTGQTSFASGLIHSNGSALSSSSLVNADVNAAAAIAVSKLAASGTDGYALTTVSSVPTWTSYASAQTNGLRVTLTTAVPVTVSDVTGATTVYFTPYVSGNIALYDGTAWHMRTTAEINIAIGTKTSGKNYDIFCYWTGSAAALEFSSAWTNDSTRADAIALQDGVWVKSGTTTRRYVGTIRTTSTTATADALLTRYVFNADNREPRELKILDADADGVITMSSPGDAWASFAGSSANAVEYVAGLAGVTVDLCSQANGHPNSDGAAFMGVGIGVDSTTVNSATGGTFLAFRLNGSSIFGGAGTSRYVGKPAIGYHKINWLQTGQGALNYTWYSKAVVTNSWVVSGMTGWVLASVEPPTSRSNVTSLSEARARRAHGAQIPISLAA